MVWVEGNHDYGLTDIMSHLVGVRSTRITHGSIDGLRHIAIHGHQFDGFQVNRVRLSRWGTSLYLQLQKLDFKSKPIARMIDRLNTRWLRMSEKVAAGAVAYARHHDAQRIFCGHTHQAMHVEQNGIDYYNSGGWVDSRLTYLTVDESGVQIHEYQESELTIVIPAKNEAKLIPRLLTSLTNQDYSKMPSTRVLVADANSTDGTPEIVMGFRDRLNVSVIRGGMPSVGRNHGAALADTPYVLFLDADIELADRSLLRRCMERAAEQAVALRDHEHRVQGRKLDRQDSSTGSMICFSICRTCIVRLRRECSCCLTARNSGSWAGFTSRFISRKITG